MAAVEVVRPAADAKGVRLQIVGDPDAGSVMGDPGRLQQAVWNLLANAIKFTPRDGRVHVTVHRNESMVEIRVSDSGRGISPTFLPHVFERFAQDGMQSSASNRSTGGLGLGLAIVKHIIELHGGTVEAESDGDGRGASFTLCVPVIAVRETRAHRVAALDPSYARNEDALLAGLHVLVVEDEEDSRELTRAVLERRQARVITAASAAEAFHLLALGPKPDVIVSDIGMPGEDGYAFVGKLRQLPAERGGTVPAVALTAFGRAEDRRKALAAGFQNHAVKPIEPRDLVIVVANLAGRYAVADKP